MNQRKNFTTYPKIKRFYADRRKSSKGNSSAERKHMYIYKHSEFLKSFSHATGRNNHILPFQDLHYLPFHLLFSQLQVFSLGLDSIYNRCCQLNQKVRQITDRPTGRYRWRFGLGRRLRRDRQTKKVKLKKNIFIPPYEQKR